MPPIIIDIEGLIGAGKSTLIDRLVTHYTNASKRIIVVREPLHKWSEILPRFYSNPQRWGYHFQTKAFYDRVIESREKWVAHAETADIFITERGVISDRLFMSTLYSQGNVDPMEYSHYLEWTAMWELLMPFTPTLYLYLTPSISEIMRRVRNRARNGEDSVSEDYQLLLQKAHDSAFGGDAVVLDSHNIPVLRVETDANFKDDDDQLHAIVNLINEKLQALNINN